MRRLGRRQLLALLVAFALVAPAITQAQPKSGLRLPAPMNREEALARGREVIADLLSRVPEPSVRTNVLRTKERGGQERQVPVRFDLSINSSGWVGVYEVVGRMEGTSASYLRVVAEGGLARRYFVKQTGSGERTLAGNQTMVTFANSDFWVADLGLEFFNWPQQLLLSNDVRKGQSCYVLLSLNPEPAAAMTPLATGAPSPKVPTSGRMGEAGPAYSQVISWIDIDSGGIVHADAFDAEKKVFKQFDPSELQRVNGRMQVQEIEMRNRRTGSRSWVSFDLR